MAGVTFSSSMVTATSADMDNRCISWLRLEEDLDVVEFPSSLVMLSLQSGHVCLIFSQGSTQFLWNSWLEEEVAEVNWADLKKVFDIYRGGTQGATNNTCGKHATNMYMYTIQHASSVCKYGLMQCMLQKHASSLHRELVSVCQCLSILYHRCTLQTFAHIFNQDTLLHLY